MALGRGLSFYSCINPSDWPLEEEIPVLSILGWILQRTSYGFGYGSPLSPAMLVLRPAEPSPFALSSSVGTSASDGALVTIVHNIRRGGTSLPPSGRRGGSQNQ